MAFVQSRRVNNNKLIRPYQHISQDLCSIPLDQFTGESEVTADDSRSSLNTDGEREKEENKPMRGLKI